MAAPSHPAARGFYVFQTALGSPLQFHPALGTSELDSLMDAYLPYPGTIKDKRASISVDFFEHFRLTGESIKFYEVPNWVNSATSSPNSTQDSGCGSSFTTSPFASTWSWDPIENASASTPSTSSSVSTPQIPSRRSRQSSRKQSASSRVGANDFSHLPGMKILTRDGRDVTNAATRGCKTKEQRDHAHLMRIMKACDSCKKKKVRCDPSHKTRPSPVSLAEQLSRPAKKARVSHTQPKPEMTAPPFDPAILGNPTSLPALPDSFRFEPFDFFNDTPLDEQTSWDEVFRFNGELDSAFPGGLDELPELQQPTIPSVPTRSPASGYLDPCDVPVALAQPGDMLVQDVPKLPYMEKNDQPHNYVDFNLYSPTSSFADPEPSTSTGLSVEPISRLETAMSKPNSPRAHEQLPRSTVHHPEGYPDTRLSDHSQGSYSPELHTLRSANSSPASLETGLATQGLPSASESPDRQELLSTVGDGTQPSSTDLHLTRNADQQSSRSPRTLHVPRATPDLVANSQSRVMSSAESSVSAPGSAQSHAVVTARQSDPGAFTAPTQAAAVAVIQRHGGDGVRQVLSRDDESASSTGIDSYRKRPVTAVGKHAETKQATAPILARSDGEQPRSETHQAATVVHDRTTHSGQAVPAVVSMSSLEQTSDVTTQANPRVSRIPLLSRGPLSGTDCSTRVEEASQARATVSATDLSELMPVAAVVSSLAAAALNCMAMFSPSSDAVAGGSSNFMWTALCAIGYGLSGKSAKTDDWTPSAKRLWTRGSVRMNTAVTRIPVLV